MVFPRDGTALQDVLGFGIADTEAGKVVRLVPPEDRIARIPYQIDVVGIRIHPRDPRQHQGRLGQLPPPMLCPCLVYVVQIFTDEPLEIGVDGRFVQRLKVPFEPALPRHVTGEYTRRFIHRLRRHLVARAVDGISHEDAAGVQRVGNGARARVTAANDRDE